MPIELKHHHGGVSVPNLDESIGWYRRVLDFEVEKRFEIPQIPAKVAMLRRGELRIELSPTATSIPTATSTWPSPSRTSGRSSRN